MSASEGQEITALCMDYIPHVHVTEVQWSNGYDFCLTCVMFTEGSRFDPGLNHFFFSVVNLLFQTEKISRR